MPPPETQKIVLQTTCAECHKSFHLSATPKSEKTGEEEIALNCPHCDAALVVAVPRSLLQTQVTFRGASVPNVNSRKQ